MANKRFSDVNPNRGDKDTAKPGMKSSARTKPAADPSGDSMYQGEHRRGGAPSGKGGKDLPSPKFAEKGHCEPSGELPPKGA